MILRCLVLVTALLAASVAPAEVIELEGKVKAVDADARTISVERKTANGTKTLNLEVIKKAGDLSSLKVGDEISFSYAPDLELVTKIGDTSTAAIRRPPDLLTLVGQYFTFGDNTTREIRVDGVFVQTPPVNDGPTEGSWENWPAIKPDSLRIRFKDPDWFAEIWPVKGSMVVAMYFYRKQPVGNGEVWFRRSENN